MLSYLLDTHILIWWQSEPERLSVDQARVLRDLEKRGQAAAISAITLRELAAALARGRLIVDGSADFWLASIEQHPSISVLPITAQIAIESVRLGPDFPNDPADQIIVATARCHGLRLLTADERIRRWGKVLFV